MKLAGLSQTSHFVSQGKLDFSANDQDLFNKDEEPELEFESEIMKKLM